MRLNSQLVCMRRSGSWYLFLLFYFPLRWEVPPQRRIAWFWLSRWCAEARVLSCSKKLNWGGGQRTNTKKNPGYDFNKHVSVSCLSLLHTDAPSLSCCRLANQTIIRKQDIPIDCVMQSCWCNSSKQVERWQCIWEKNNLLLFFFRRRDDEQNTTGFSCLLSHPIPTERMDRGMSLWKNTTHKCRA